MVLGCKASSEGQLSTPQNSNSAVHETHATNSNGTSNGESRAKDIPNATNKAIKHNAPDQTRIDSIKQAKNAQKH